MKRIFTPVRIFSTLGVITTAVFVLSFVSGQGQSNDKDKTKKHRSEKRIEIVDENGQKKVTITTIENGNKTVETYTGEQAEEYMRSNGNGNQNFQMHFDFDTTMGKNSFDFSMNGFGEEFSRDMKELMEELRSSNSQLNMDLNELLKSMDSSASGNHFNYSFRFDQDAENSLKDLDSLMKNLDINININGDDFSEKIREEAGKHTKGRSVMIEDLGKNDEKNMAISDVSFRPNNEGNFTLRYKSQNMDMTEVTVMDESGKSLYNERISATGTVLRNIELPANSGNYQLTLKQGKKKMSKKLIIQ